MVSSVPWTSMTWVDLARWCRVSMFWVMISSRKPSSCREERARWAGLGWALKAWLASGRSQLKKRLGWVRKALREATSKGLWRVHNPLSAERKSGIPEGVEIPAPVRAVVCSACLRRWEILLTWAAVSFLIAVSRTSADQSFGEFTELVGRHAVRGPLHNGLVGAGGLVG